ncbi:TetR/AcrR family transcriptional regulator [Streptomyces sp. NPDC057474]|uniref:TetR/AcrR family transcriptional regulator n=1 Tax=Streptomyces sp. NPDC057474 TaxID=3346144 RepID=UPI0036BB02BD
MGMGSRVKEPQQERSRESLERVLDAGFEILAEDGWHDFTLARVCDRAGVSVGLLYRRFHGREELLAALQDRWLDAVDRTREELASRQIDWAAIDASEAVQVAIGGVVESFLSQKPATHVLGRYGAFDEAGLNRMAKISQDYAAWYRTGLMHHADAINHPDPARAIDFSYRLILDTVIRRTTYGDTFDTGTATGDWDAFSAELWSVCCAYLFRPQSVGRTDS